MIDHVFSGVWITDEEFAELAPRQVFHRQLQRVDLPCDEHRDRHSLFRRHFTLNRLPQSALLYITADDYYKAYVNGGFVSQGPAPAYPDRLGYLVVDITGQLHTGENVLAVHTLYQGLINRVWVSGDNRHGLLCDLVLDGETVWGSDERFLTHRHTAYAECGTVGYATQFMESYDSAAPEVDFFAPSFDDSGWTPACRRAHTDYRVVPQPTAALVFDTVKPVKTERRGNTLFLDFGSTSVGSLRVSACGQVAAA